MRFALKYGVLLVCFCFLTFYSSAQSYDISDARVSAKAGIGSTGIQELASFQNPAIISDSSLAVSVMIQNRFGVKDLSSVGLFVKKKTGNGNLFAGYSNFGNQYFQENRVNLGYGLKITENFNLGIANNTYLFSYTSANEKQVVSSFNLGVLYIQKQLSIGAFAKNFVSTKEFENYYPSSVSLGLSYNLGKTCISAEIEKFDNNFLILKTAIQYRLSNNLELIYGVIVNRGNQHLGLNFQRKSWVFSLAFFYQNTLGISPSFSGEFYK